MKSDAGCSIRDAGACRQHPAGTRCVSETNAGKMPAAQWHGVYHCVVFLE